MDGVYENADFPGFTIADGKLRIEGGELPGRVQRGKFSFYCATERALRYEICPDGYRFVVVAQAALYAAERKESASAVILI